MTQLLTDEQFFGTGTATANRVATAPPAAGPRWMELSDSEFMGTGEPVRVPIGEEPAETRSAMTLPTAPRQDAAEISSMQQTAKAVRAQYVKEAETDPAKHAEILHEVFSKVDPSNQWQLAYSDDPKDREAAKQTFARYYLENDQDGSPRAKLLDDLMNFTADGAKKRLPELLQKYTPAQLDKMLTDGSLHVGIGGAIARNALAAPLQTAVGVSKAGWRIAQTFDPTGSGIASDASGMTPEDSAAYQTFMQGERKLPSTAGPSPASQLVQEATAMQQSLGGLAREGDPMMGKTIGGGLGNLPLMLAGTPGIVAMALESGSAGIDKVEQYEQQHGTKVDAGTKALVGLGYALATYLTMKIPVHAMKDAPVLNVMAKQGGALALEKGPAAVIYNVLSSSLWTTGSMLVQGEAEQISHNFTDWLYDKENYLKPASLFTGTGERLTSGALASLPMLPLAWMFHFNRRAALMKLSDSLKITPEQAAGIFQAAEQAAKESGNQHPMEAYAAAMVKSMREYQPEGPIPGVAPDMVDAPSAELRAGLRPGELPTGTPIADTARTVIDHPASDAQAMRAAEADVTRGLVDRANERHKAETAQIPADQQPKKSEIVPPAPTSGAAPHSSDPQAADTAPGDVSKPSPGELTPEDRQKYQEYVNMAWARLTGKPEARGIVATLRMQDIERELGPDKIQAAKAEIDAAASPNRYAYDAHIRQTVGDAVADASMPVMDRIAEVWASRHNASPASFWSNLRVGEPDATSDLNQAGLFGDDVGGALTRGSTRSLGIDAGRVETARAEASQELVKAVVPIISDKSNKTDPKSVYMTLKERMKGEADGLFSNPANPLPEVAAAVDEALHGRSLFQRKVNRAQFIHVDWTRLRELGVTADWREAGYIAPTGKMVDLSGKREGGTPGVRAYDHRELGGVAGMQEAMASGYIRLMPESGDINISADPSAAQLRLVRRIAEERGGNIGVELADGLGKWNEELHRYDDPARKFEKVYERGTSPQQIVNDIIEFFSGNNPEDSALQQANRGAITWRDGVAFVRLLHSADATTALHEFVHYARRVPGMFDEAENAILERACKVEKGQWDRASEERFASMFEEYLRRGKAPTAGLKRIFQRLKEFFRAIYDTQVATLPPEVRAIFDRMLGAKRSAESVEATSKVRKLYRQQRDSLVETVSKAYDHYFGESVDHLRERDGQGDGETDTFTMAFGRKFPGELLDRVRSLMKAKNPTEAQVIAYAERMGFTRNEGKSTGEEFANSIGWDEYFNRLHRMRSGQVEYLKEAARAVEETAAGLYDYDMAAKAKALRDLLEHKDAPIEDLDAYLKEHAESLRDRQEPSDQEQPMSDAEAQDAMAGGMQDGDLAAALRDEVAMYQEEAKTDTKAAEKLKESQAMLDALTNGRDPQTLYQQPRAEGGTGRLPMDPFKPNVDVNRDPLTFARAIINANRNPEIRREMRQVMRAGRIAQSATIADMAELAKVLPMKYRGRIVQTMQRVRTDKAGIKSFVQRVNNLLDESEKAAAIEEFKATVPSDKDLSHMRPFYRDRIKATIDGIDPFKLTERKRGTLMAMADWLKENGQFTNMPEERLEEMKAAAARLDKTSLRDLSTAEIRSLTQLIGQYVAQNKLTNEMAEDRMHRTQAAAISDAAQELVDTPRTLYARFEDAPKMSLFRRGLSMAHSWLIRGRWDGETGMSRLGPTFLQFGYENPMEGAVEHARIVQGQFDALKARLAGMGHEWGSKQLAELSDAIIGKGNAKRIDVHLLKSGTVKMTPAELMTLMAHMDQGYVLDQVREDAVTFTLPSGGAMRRKLRMDVRELESLRQQYPEYYALMREMKSIIADLVPEANKKAVEHDGFERFREGDDYWPVLTDAMMHSNRKTEEMLKAYALMLPDNQGMLKERQGKSGPIMLEDAFQAFARHSHAMATYMAMTPHIRNFLTLVEHGSIKTLIVQKYGQKMKDWLDRRLEAMVMKSQAPGSDLDKAVNMAAHRIVQAKLSLNPSPAAKQIGGLFTLVTALDDSLPQAWKWLTKYGVPMMYDKDVRALMDKYAPLLRDRHEGLASRLVSAEGGSVAGLYGYTKTLDRGMGMLTVMDTANSQAAFASFAGKLTELHPDWSQEQVYTEAGKLATKAVSRTQNATHPLDASDLMLQGSNNPLMRLVFLFQSQPHKNWNVVLRTLKTYADGKRTAADKLKLVGDLASVLVVQNLYTGAVSTGWKLGKAYAAYAAASAIAGAFNKQVEQQQKDDKVLENYLWTSLDDASSAIPVASAAVETARNFLKDKPQKFNGLFDNPASQAITDIGEEAYRMFQGASKGSEPVKSGPNAGKTNWQANVTERIIHLLRPFLNLAGLPDTPQAIVTQTYDNLVRQPQRVKGLPSLPHAPRPPSQRK